MPSSTPARALTGKKGKPTGHKKSRKKSRASSTVTKITSPRDRAKRKSRAASKQSSGTSKKKSTRPTKTPAKRSKLASNSNVSPAPQPSVEVDPLVFLNLHVLLSTDVYRDVPVPADYVDHYFRYSVESYNASTKMFTLKYERQTIRVDGLNFKVDEKSTKDPLSEIALETVEKGLDLFQNAVGRIVKHTRQCQSVVKLSLERSSYDPPVIKPEDVDVSDINELARQNPKGYMSDAVAMVSYHVVFFFTVLTNAH